MQIVKAAEDQFDAFRSFHHSLIDGMAGSPYDIGWKKDIFPPQEFLKESIEAGELYLCVEDSHIVGAMVLNHHCNEEYRKVKWQTMATEEEALIVHALGVHPQYSGNGCAKAMARKAIEIAKREHMQALRLDVLG